MRPRWVSAAGWFGAFGMIASSLLILAPIEVRDAEFWNGVCGVWYLLSALAAIVWLVGRVVYGRKPTLKPRWISVCGWIGVLFFWAGLGGLFGLHGGWIKAGEALGVLLGLAIGGFFSAIWAIGSAIYSLVMAHARAVRGEHIKDAGSEVPPPPSIPGPQPGGDRTDFSVGRSFIPR